MAQIFYHNLNGKNKLDISNWVAIKEIDGGIHAYINTHVYMIPEITIDQFHDAYRATSMTQYMFKYLHSNLPCEKCKGKTRLDWIEKSVGVNLSEQYRHIARSHYIRDGRKPIGLFRTCNISYDGIYHISSPMIYPGYEPCIKCSGTGLRVFGEIGPLHKYYHPKGGVPWDQSVKDVARPPRYR